MPTQEHVLCCERGELPLEWLPLEGSMVLSEVELFATLARVTPHWIQRDLAEGDPRFKQWIPYVLVQRPDGRIASYRRRGTESRLHGCLSLGVGGHVNPKDAKEGAYGSELWESALRGGLRRELMEEFPCAVVGRTEFLGVINEDSSAVGRVHLGVVFVHRCQTWDSATEGELADLCWVVPMDLAQDPALDRYETWSCFALDLLLARQVPGRA